MAERRGYWSVDDCGWVASPGVVDALATPWAGHALELPQAGPNALDASDVLRLRPSSAAVPGQRDTATAAHDETSAGTHPV